MRAEVFAVEDTAVQVCWVAPKAGAVRVVAAWRDGRVATEAPEAASGEPGAVVVRGLPTATTITITISGPGWSADRRVTTLVPPPGRLLSRFAAINDIHLGDPNFGPWFSLVWNDDSANPAPIRNLRAALEEIKAWGAEALLVKGDMTQRGRIHEWEQFGSTIAEAGLPVVMIEGNHETKRGSVDGRAIMARYGVELAVDRPTHLDLPGVRLIGTPTARVLHGNGRITRRVREETVDLLKTAPRGAVVALHQYPQRFRHPTFYPTGIPGPEARLALDAFAAAHPATLVLAGHTHRHRRHNYGPMVVAETGSTKDFPGSWAGYQVYEGGILQTTRRIMDPDVIRWTERGRRVIGGIWGVWAPGVRSHRCFAYVWPGGPKPSALGSAGSLGSAGHTGGTGGTGGTGALGG